VLRFAIAFVAASTLALLVASAAAWTLKPQPVRACHNPPVVGMPVRVDPPLNRVEEAEQAASEPVEKEALSSISSLFCVAVGSESRCGPLCEEIRSCAPGKSADGSPVLVMVLECRPVIARITEAALGEFRRSL
jgi:hypothetical protein